MLLKNHDLRMKRIELFLLSVIIICMLSVAGCTSSGHQNTETLETTRIPTQTPVVTVQVTSSPVIAPTTAPNSKSDLLQIGAFNVQIFGVSKAAKPEVMDVLADM